MRKKSMLRTVFGAIRMLATATVLWLQTSQVVAVRAGRLFDSKAGKELTKQFEWLVQHGMTPAAALQAATVVDSVTMGWQDQIGSLDKGKYADIAAVSGDPLQDTTEMQRVKFVLKGGKVIKNELLLQ